MSDKEFKSIQVDSPNTFVPALAIGVGASVLTGAIGAIGAGKRKREAEAKERAAREEMKKQEAIYRGIDLSNPFENLTNRFEGLQNQYSGLENTAEDLTINQQQAQFEAQQMQQSQANIMGNLRGAAGSSGIAALAQSLAQQGQIGAQRASASIGQQEARNQQMRATQAGRLQEMEARGQSAVDLQRAQGAAQLDASRAQGEMWSIGQNLQREQNILSMRQGEVTAYNAQAQAANQAKWDAISGGVSNALSFAGNFESVTG